MTESAHPTYSLNELTQVLFETMPLGAVYHNERGEIILANPAAQEILGLTLDQLQGRTSLDPRWRAIHEDGSDFSGTEHPAMQALRSGQPIHNVRMGVFNPQKESYRWLKVTATPRCKQGGDAPYIVIVTFEDITEQKKAEHNLRGSDQRLSSIFEKSPIAIGISRLSDNKFVEVNPAMLKLFGFSRGEMIGRTSLELGLWANPEDHHHLIRHLTTQPYVYNFETIHHRKDGSQVNILISAQITQIQNEKYLLEQITNITKRKRAEQALIEQEHFTTSILNTVPSIVYVYDMETQNNVFSNRGITSVLGYPHKHMQTTGGEIFNRLIHPEDLPLVLEFQSRILAAKDGQVLENEYRAKHQDGSWRVLRSYESPFLRNLDGTVKQKIGIALDVTERKRTDDQLHKSRGRLTELSRQLVKVQETERRAIGRELHDQIGQMLTTIKITLDIATQLSPEAATKKVEQAQAILTDLLNRVSRLSLQLRPPMLDDLGLIPALLWHVNQFQEQTKIEVEFSHNAVEEVRFDSEVETTAYRIIQEALTNVARHARAKQVRLEVQLIGDGLQIQIEDNGQGFDTVSAFSENRGLSGMQERVRLLDGLLQIDSKVGIGTFILVQLPIKENAE